MFIRKYLGSPAFYCFTLLTCLGLMQALLGRNTGEGLKFIGFGLVFALWHFLMYRKEKTVRESLKALTFFLIPPLIVVITAAIEGPKEADSRQYQELGSALKYPRNEQVLKIIQAHIKADLEDGKISKWEAAKLRNEIFEHNGFIDGTNPHMSQDEARERLLTILKENQEEPDRIKYFGKPAHENGQR